jgi:hexosaminidase
VVSSAPAGALARVIKPSPSFFTAAAAGDSLLEAAMTRYGGLIFAEHGAAEGGAPAEGDTCHITVRQPVSAMGMDTDESYELRVPAAAALQIIANTTVGAIRAMETLSQLICYDFDQGGRYVVEGAPWVILDEPRFPWRGLMIDTSR